MVGFHFRVTSTPYRFCTLVRVMVTMKAFPTLAVVLGVSALIMVED